MRKQTNNELRARQKIIINKNDCYIDDNSMLMLMISKKKKIFRNKLRAIRYANRGVDSRMDQQFSKHLFISNLFVLSFESARARTPLNLLSDGCT